MDTKNGDKQCAWCDSPLNTGQLIRAAMEHVAACIHETTDFEAGAEACHHLAEAWAALRRVESDAGRNEIQAESLDLLRHVLAQAFEHMRRGSHFAQSEETD